MSDVSRVGSPIRFIVAEGLSAIRRRQALVQGRTVTGAQTVFAGLILLGWAAGLLGFAALVLARWMVK